jgi:hypothetical protein
LIFGNYVKAYNLANLFKDDGKAAGSGAAAGAGAGAKE